MLAILIMVICITVIGLLIYFSKKLFNEPQSSTFKKITLDFYNSIYLKAQNRLKDSAIGFGYTGCKDITVNTFDLLDKLNIPFKPREKTHIVTIKDFVETFASFFRAGASSEVFMESKEDFELLLLKMADLHKVITFGGNAPHMALRASYENFNAVLVADIGQEEINTLKSLDVNKKIHFVPVDESRETSDIHLIFEYPAKEYKGIKAPKANKFYLNHDTISPQLLAMDKYLDIVTKLNVNKHAFSGFHLIQKLPANKAIKLISKVRGQWDLLRRRDKQTIHMEIGAFQDPEIYEAVIENLLLRADSVGINEQEVLILHTLLKKKTFKTLAAPFSDPSSVLQKVFEIIDILEEKKAVLSRFHIHAKLLHHLCYRGNNIKQHR